MADLRRPVVKVSKADITLERGKQLPRPCDQIVTHATCGLGGAVAENVAVGCETEECARRMWMQSPRHRANMMLGGCQAVASAVSASGRRYWVMEIGGGRGGGASRDFSVDRGNAP